MKLKPVLIKICYVILAFLLTFVPGTIAEFAHGAFGTNSITSTVICNIVTVVLFGTAYYLFKYHKKDDAFKLHTSFDIKRFISIVGSFIILSLLLNPIFYWITTHISSVGITERTEAISRGDLILYVILTVLVAPICEEIMYRWFMYSFLKRRFSWMTAMIISSILFGMAHNTGPHLVIGSVFGMFCCMCYELSGSCWVPIFTHMVYNAVTLFVPSKLIGNSTVIVWLFIFIVLVIFCFEMFRIESYMQGIPKKSKHKT